MNSKGFTLIELLVTIALMAIISVTVGLSMSSMLNRQKEDNYDYFKTTIAKAACTCWGIETAEDRKKDCATIGGLIDMGYLRKDMKDPSSNNRDGLTINDNSYRNKTITITLTSGELECTFNK